MVGPSSGLGGALYYAAQGIWGGVGFGHFARLRPGSPSALLSLGEFSNDPTVVGVGYLADAAT